MSVLQAIFDGIPDPLLLLDGDFTVNMPLNTAAADYYGVPNPQEVIGKRCYAALRGRSEPCEGCPYLSVIINGHGGTFERKGLMDPDRFEEVTIFPTGIGVLIRIKDITRAKLMERQLIQSQKLASLGLLVSGIVHEIKNLNNCVTFNIPILREYLKELIPIIDDYAERNGDFELFGMSYPEFRGDLFSLLGNLEHASDRISATVSDLGEFVRRGDKGRQRWVELKEVIERGVTVCRCHVQRMVKSFEVDIDGDLCPIFTDPQALEQVLVNLLINAGQAAENEDSWVRLRARRGDTCGDGVVIEVSDNGCGMDEEVRGKVFEPLFSTKEPGRGTGLGLFVAHTLIEELGGRIEVDSEPGKGSTFRIILNNANHRRIKNQQFSAIKLPVRRQVLPQ
ncbi:MAG: PAS domain-containing protein [Methanomassiliicoccales archaeon]|nr:MAG: PAS domain-containing protein [Methanomassiliicoccales archaeon]